MNVLVLGGTRFFGKTLVEQLVSAGHAVTVLSRGKLPPPAGAKHLVADRSDPAALAAALATEELPFGEDGWTWACDTTRLEHELGVTPTPAAAWMSELGRGPAVVPLASEQAHRTAELTIARTWVRLVPGARSRLR
jgi:NAD(P)-dependent dehydrogenase (short-subunit alcohol dehydrogenase family)